MPQGWVPLPLFFILAFSTGCENRQEEINLAARSAIEPVEQIINAEVLYSDSALVKVKLNAPILERFIEPHELIELKKGVRLVFYNANRQIVSTLTANYARSKPSEKIMEAKNDVVVVNEKGEKLNTEHLIWNEQTRMIYSEAFSKITTANEIIYGDGMEANEDFSRYKIKNVKGTIKLDKKTHAQDS